jgi:transposase
MQIACRAMGYDRWSEGGLDALEDTAPHPGSVWNRLPDETRADIIEFALEHEGLTARELAVKYTDEKQYFVSESSVYRMLKAEDLVTAPAHIVMKGETLSAIGPRTMVEQ